MAGFEVMRSVANFSFHVIVRAGEFDQLPASVRHEGPWQIIGRGEMDKLRADYRFQIARQGYAVAYHHISGFSAEDLTQARKVIIETQDI